jgi:competence ComEA-like helix-hairpin-helix protein
MVGLQINQDENSMFTGMCINSGKINFNTASFNDIMNLKNVNKYIANDILDFAKDTTITDDFDLLELESIDIDMLKSWHTFIDDMRIDINYINEEELMKVKGVGEKLAKKIMQKKEELGQFSNLKQLKEIENLKKDTFENLKLRFTL